MKISYILLITLISFLVLLAIFGIGATVTITEMNNTETKENLTFSGNSNITRYIEIPYDANVSYANFTIEGFSNSVLNFNGSDLSYKNISQTGTYKNEMINWTNSSTESIKSTQTSLTRIEWNLTDSGNNITFDYSFGVVGGTPGSGNVNETHFVLSAYNISSGLWEIIDSYDNTSYTQSASQQDCQIRQVNITNPNFFSNNITSLNMSLETVDDNPSGSNTPTWSCDGSTNGLALIIFSKTNYKISSTPSNPFIEVGTPDGNYEWNESGNFTTTNSTGDYNNSLQSAITGCTPIDYGTNNNCTIAHLFHSDTSGIIQYSDINITYDEQSPSTPTDIVPSSGVFENVTLNCSGSIDPQSDTITYFFEWSNETNFSTTNEIGNHTENSTLTWDTTSIAAQSSITIRCTGSDNYFNSTFLNSTSTIQINRVPILNNANITSSDSLNRTNGTLSGLWSASDFDSDTLTNTTKWYNNTSEVTVLANFEDIASGNISKKEEWIFEVTVSDGTNTTSLNTSTFTVNNSIPIIDSVNITTLPAGDSDDLTCIFTFNDDDGDTNETSYFDWLINGTSQNVPSQILNSNNTSLNDLIMCSVIIFDGDGNSTETFSSNATIGDSTAPTLSNASVSPTSLTSGSTVTIKVAAIDSSSSIDEVKVNVKDPNEVVTIYTMSLDEGSTYVKLVVPTTIGVWQVVNYTATDTSGNLGSLTSGTEFSVTAVPSGGGVGGGGGVSRITVVQSTTNITEIKFLCGNLLCEEGESPITCSQDCKVNFETGLFCLFTKEQECLYTQAWFFDSLILGLGGLIIYFFFILPPKGGKNG